MLRLQTCPLTELNILLGSQRGFEELERGLPQSDGCLLGFEVLVFRLTKHSAYVFTQDKKTYTLRHTSLDPSSIIFFSCSPKPPCHFINRPERGDSLLLDVPTSHFTQGICCCYSGTGDVADQCPMPTTTTTTVTRTTSTDTTVTTTSTTETTQTTSSVTLTTTRTITVTVPCCETLVNLL